MSVGLIKKGICMNIFKRLKLAVSVFVWGDSYRRPWEIIGRDKSSAYEMMNHSPSEEALIKSGRATAERMQRALKIDMNKRVLEIGCGVGRIGKELAPVCKEWVGVDVSGGFISIAKERMKDLPNVTLQRIDSNDLSCFPDDSFDVVYVHIVFIHIDCQDVYQYIKEIKRILKPHGIFYFDLFNLLDEWGFVRFEYELDTYKDKKKPVHRVRFSTPQEINRFVKGAGLHVLHFHDTSYLLQMFTTKIADGEVAQDTIPHLKEFLDDTKCLIPEGPAQWWDGLR